MEEKTTQQALWGTHISLFGQTKVETTAMGHGFVADDAVDGGNAGDVLLCADVVLKQPERKQNIWHVTVLLACFQALDKKNNVLNQKLTSTFKQIQRSSLRLTFHFLTVV